MTCKLILALFCVVVGVLLVRASESCLCVDYGDKIEQLEKRNNLLRDKFKELHDFVMSLPEAKAKLAGPIDMTNGNMINNVFYRGEHAEDDKGNVVDGIGNVLNGMNNKITGHKNQISGNDNQIQRSGAIIQGSGNRFSFNVKSKPK